MNKEESTPEETTVTEEKLTPVPIVVEDAIPYQIDWDVLPDPKFLDGYSLKFGMRYTVNPEVMMVVSEIVRHQLQEVLDSDDTRQKKDRMPQVQKEQHVKAIRLMERNINGLARAVYTRHLAKQDRQRKEADGTLPKLEIVSDMSTIKKVNASKNKG